jgi:hypothetical protein
MASRSLTTRAVRQRLARAQFDSRALTLTEQTTRARIVGGGVWETYTEVHLSGPAAGRKEAERILTAAGLTSVSYSDFSVWSISGRRR